MQRQLLDIVTEKSYIRNNIGLIILSKDGCFKFQNSIPRNS